MRGSEACETDRFRTMQTSALAADVSGRRGCAGGRLVGAENQAQRARYCCTSARVSVFSAARLWCTRR